MRHKIISCTLFAILLVLSSLFCSCGYSKNLCITGKYELSGDFEYTDSEVNNDILVIGQKDAGKCLQGYSLSFTAPSGKDISIAYRSHIQDAGWYEWSGSDTEITYEQYYGIDTIQIFLFGKDAFMYDISYRIAVVGEDWQEWVSNGTMAGTPEEHRPIEAIEIRLDERGDYKAPTWTLTQFSDESGQQAMFYTIRNNEDGTLIVIDGGFNANTNQVRSVINMFGGHVNHWFLTHYDEDHASAFNDIYANPDGIEIDSVYCTPLDYDYYIECAVDRPWETPWVYETFLNQTSGDERIHYLSRGDTLEFDGLQIEIFNSYDQVVLDTGVLDVANYASLVIKITGEEDSVLFCGDVQGPLWSILATMYGDRLEAEYVQPGHHGNNGVPPEEWAVVNADVMLFDAPEWLANSDDHTAKALIEWCHENGIETYEFATAPNSFPFS